MNADTLVWTIVHEMYGPTGNLSKFIGRTEFHDRLVPLIEEAMRADAKPQPQPVVHFKPKPEYQKDDCLMPSHAGRSSSLVACFGTAEIRCCPDPHCLSYASATAAATGVLRGVSQSRSDSALESESIYRHLRHERNDWRNHARALEAVVDRLTGALGEMTFGREAAEHERDELRTNLLELRHNLELKDFPLIEFVHEELGIPIQVTTSLTARELFDAIKRRLAQINTEAADSLSTAGKLLAEANSERLTDAAITELEQRTADRLSAYIDNAYTRRMMAASICADVHAARGRTEPSVQPDVRQCRQTVNVFGLKMDTQQCQGNEWHVIEPDDYCATHPLECLCHIPRYDAPEPSAPTCPVIVRRDNAAIFQEVGVLIASGPCGNVMPCAKHSAEQIITISEVGVSGSVDGVRLRTWESGWCPRCQAPRLETCKRMRLIPAPDSENEYSYQCAPRSADAADNEPIPLALYCRKCGLRHIDVDDATGKWATTRHHRKHLCKPSDGGCGNVWQPFEYNTVGVADVVGVDHSDHECITEYKERQMDTAAAKDATVSFRSELQHLINRNSRENESNTPDWILADYLAACLDALDAATNARSKWYGVFSSPGEKHVTEQAETESCWPNARPREADRCGWGAEGGSCIFQAGHRGDHRFNNTNQDMSAEIRERVLLDKIADYEERISPSEAVYGFAGWLTTRPVITKMGATEECAVIADLVNEFCVANTLPPPREQWGKGLAHPPSGAPATTGTKERTS